MARCANCANSAVNHTNTNCIHLTGDGSVATPLIATQIISPDAGNELVCRANGLFAPPGGGGGQVNYFTVATPGPNGFGGLYATPPTLLASADYVGDGINDSVAIQAAIDASATLAATTGEGAVILILPGLYVVNTTLHPKGIPLVGAGPAQGTLFYTSVGFGAPANTRTIDSTVSGPDFISIENIQIQAVTGGAAVLKGQSLYMVNCVVVGDAKGADAGLIDVGSIANPISSSAFGRFENNVVNGTFSPFPDPGLNLSGQLASNYVISHNSFTANLVFTGNSTDNVEVSGNLFNSSGILLNAQSLTKFKIRENIINDGSITATLAGGSSFFWTIVDNSIVNGQINIDSLIVSKIKGNTIQSTLFGTAFLLSNSHDNIISDNNIDFAKNSGMILTTAHSNIITGNRIRFFSAAAANVDDGIRIVTSDHCTVENNSLESTQGRYGIFAVSGNLNYITNNRLNGSAVTASFHDTATGTVVAAGNYL